MLLIVDREFQISSENELEEVADYFIAQVKVGDVVLLEGELGVGKTTLVRTILRRLGWEGPVKSPTYPILIPYDIDPPILHADLYRISEDDVGLEEAMLGHISFIEWPSRLPRLSELERSWRVNFEFEGDARRITIQAPQ